jgi:hypothetical protein
MGVATYPEGGTVRVLDLRMFDSVSSFRSMKFLKFSGEIV